MVLRLDEHYVSVQGEGPRVGLPTQFVRFGGCNLRCPGWPCDTQHAIQPEFRKEWIKKEPLDIVARAYELKYETGANNICFTGGEPFLQQRGDLETLFRELTGDGFTVECFSNGTLEYPFWASGIRFVMDWKLDGSGEGGVNHATRWKNLKLMNNAGDKIHQAVKFVLKDEDDLKEAAVHYTNMLDQFRYFNLDIFYGRVWDAKWTDAEMIDAVLKRKLPWRLNMQVHNYIWDRSLRGI
jgi:7-carboxy-7-deazaguanine synthase